MRILICLIAKLENLYIGEFIEHYRNLGVTNIVIYDNNEIDGERFEEVIRDQIDSGFVIIKDIRGRKVDTEACLTIQLNCYNECYWKMGPDYDWVAFFDTDEYLTLPEGFSTLPEFLSDSRFKDFGMIHLNWMYYGDNELLRYEDKPLQERFKSPCLPEDPEQFFENRHVKTIIRGGVNGVVWINQTHTPLTWIPCCDGRGERIVESFSPFVKPEYDGAAYLKHFGTKTIEEYVSIKMARGFADMPYEEALEKINLKEFFRRNKKTRSKVEIGKSLIRKFIRRVKP